MVRIWRAYTPLLVLWLIYFFGLRLALATYGTEIELFPTRYVPIFALAIGGFILVALLVFYARYISLGQIPARERFARLTKNVRWVEIIGPGPLLSFVFVFTTMSMFAAFKPHIPDMNPFDWDPVFIGWDRALLFGYDAWELTHGLLPWRWATLIVDRLYLAWFLVVLATTCVVAFSPLQSRVRLAYLMTFILNWMIAGTVLAIVFSSAGPVFMDRLSGDDSYLPLLVRLSSAPEGFEIWTLRTIEMLWGGYIKDPGVVPFGISAFPSLHVCMTTLVVLYLGQISRMWSRMAWIFLAIILFGSVHLGWHYLVDGIAGMLVCWANWRASLWFSGWWLRG
ncbi:MAG: phosphatase PAP2 family protein [Paracoccaceae bacterium]